MYICSDSYHGEIVHEADSCPACDRIAVLESKNSDLQDEVTALENEVYNLEQELAEAKCS